jgi:peroxiredoxin Q/BCP
MTDDTRQAVPAVGDAAPELVLPDDTGTLQDRAAQRGRWVVLFFYPKDFTSGCTIEVCDFRDRGAAFRDAGAVVWGVSVRDSASKAAFTP